MGFATGKRIFTVCVQSQQKTAIFTHGLVHFPILFLPDFTNSNRLQLRLRPDCANALAFAQSDLGLAEKMF